MEEDEEALLAQAIALSMQENTDMSDATADAAAPAATPAPAAAAASTAAAPAAGATTDASAADIDLAMQDPDFINSLLAGVPGADGDQIDVRTHTQQTGIADSRLQMSPNCCSHVYPLVSPATSFRCPEPARSADGPRRAEAGQQEGREPINLHQTHRAMGGAAREQG